MVDKEILIVVANKENVIYENMTKLPIKYFSL